MIWRALAALAICGGLVGCDDLKPARILSPESYGMVCTSAHVCIDDTTRLDEAVALRAAAVTAIERQFGPFTTPPRVLFCTTDACYAQFANTGTLGINFGTYGAVIAPRGWRDYIVRHELIHHVQNERFGSWRASRLPRWFIEGMAYSLSDDPRRPLPGAGIEDYRARYEAWEAAGNIWTTPPS